MNTMPLLSVLAVAGMCAGGAFAEPEISNITVHQRWPWSRLVDIDFETKNATEPFDVIVKAWNGDRALELPEASLSGTCGVSANPGVHRIVFDPAKTAYTNNEVLADFRVALSVTNTPLYMIVDLTKSAGEAGQIEYVYESDLTNGLWGAWERNPVTNMGTVVKSVIWTGVTNGTTYKADKLVLRRIHAGTFGMGDANLSTTLTRDFYAGVFLVTQRQWELLTGKRPSRYHNSQEYAAYPVEEVSYDDIRGATNDTPSVNWPLTGHSVVSSGSFLELLRAKTGLPDFDLPTDAQWEYACRAGTSTYFNDGLPDPENVNSNSQMDVLGRYIYNGGRENNTAIVGSYRANAWGLYDMHGNAWEWCLDWYDSSITGGTDPVGSLVQIWRMQRGGAFNCGARDCRSSLRDRTFPINRYDTSAFRLVRNL